MNITITDQEHCKKQVRIEIPATTVLEESDKVASQLAKQVNVPGFRRGHVPKSVVKSRFKKELRDEVLSSLLPNYLGDAIKEKDLKVLGKPSIEDLKFGDDESIDVTFTVEVAPVFDLANYKSLPVIKKQYKVGDEDLEKTINRLREGQAELVPVEGRGAQPGDLVTVNLTGTFDVSADGGSEANANKGGEGDIADRDVEIEIGAQGVLKEFNEALTETRAGDKPSFSIEYAADYKPDRFAGKKVNYTAEVTAVRVKELPDVDDAFAQTVSEEFKNVEDLRADIRSRLQHQADHRSDSEMRSKLLEQLVDRNRFEVPEYAVDKQIDSRLSGLFRQLASQGMDPRKLQLDWEQLRDGQRERAEREVRAAFILDSIASAEKIEVSEQELNDEIEQYAAASNQTAAALKARLTKEGSLDSIEEQVKNRKALDLVIASAETRIEEVQGLGDQNEATGESGPE